MDIPKGSLAPLVDLGAFDLKRLREGTLKLSRLKEQGINEIVLMEDRAPIFFLNYNGYNAGEKVPLNRHMDTGANWTMADLKKLVDGLHENGIKVVIGFWGNAKNWENNPFIRQNWDALKPVIPISDDINPLCFVTDENGKQITFAQYIAQQYNKLNRDFNFDGLFLGDGLMGYRAFLDPYGPYDFSDASHLWTDFYRRVYEGVKGADEGDSLWAYDCLGKGGSNASSHGLDLREIAPYLDNYVAQTYGSDAWGENYMALPGYNLERDTKEISDLPPGIKAKTRYTMGIGDSVEGWAGTTESVRSKHKALSPHAKKGTLGVWSNGMVRKLV